jgi:hypothetical protein
MAAEKNKNLEQSVGSLKGDLSIDTTFDPPDIFCHYTLLFPSLTTSFLLFWFSRDKFSNNSHAHLHAQCQCPDPVYVRTHNVFMSAAVSLAMYVAIFHQCLFLLVLRNTSTLSCLFWYKTRIVKTYNKHCT